MPTDLSEMIDMDSYRIGVDIGGTFTDLVMMNESTGELRLVKMASTPSDPSVGFLNTVERALRESDVAAADVSYNVHGTTVATNTLIEGKGARTALVATEGFRDVLEIARQIRPRLYDIFCEKPKPVIPRNRCYGVPERLDYAGQVLAPLDEEAVRDVARRMKEAAVESVAVCLLHSYVNPAHEKRVRDLLRQELPGVFLSISSDLCPEMREYFRASTTAINAVVMPIVTRYLENLENRLARLGVGVGLHLMTSAGGVMASDVAKREPVHLIESGPAAGVIATRYLGDLLGTRDVISFDMGGTTAKLGLVEGETSRSRPISKSEAPPWRRAREPATRSGLPSSTWWRSAPEGAASPGSIPVERCGSVREAAARIRVRPATERARRSPASPTPTWFWDGSTRNISSGESRLSIRSWRRRRSANWPAGWGWESWRRPTGSSRSPTPT